MTLSSENCQRADPANPKYRWSWTFHMTKVNAELTPNKQMALTC